MKIAILSDFPFFIIPELGEVYRPEGHYATWLPQLVKGFAEQAAFEIHWITLTRAVSAPRVVSWQGQTFHLLPAGRKGRRAPTFYFEDRQAIKECLLSIAPCIVHGWGTEDVYALAAATSGYPNIVSMQGILSQYALKTLLSPRHYLQALIELFVLYKADRVTVESEWGRERLLRRNPALRVDVIEYGIDEQFLETAWRPDPQRPVALFVGSLIPPKGVQDLVAAYHDPALAGTELWIVGDGDERWAGALQASSAPNVKWLGRRSRSDTAALMSQAWCLALPTRVDTSPNVVKEARVIGLPVVTTPCGGQVSYIANGKNGFLVQPGDTKSLASALLALLSDFERCRMMGARRHETHREMLHPAETARKFTELYHKGVGGNLC